MSDSSLNKNESQATNTEVEISSSENNDNNDTPKVNATQVESEIKLITILNEKSSDDHLNQIHKKSDSRIVDKDTIIDMDIMEACMHPQNIGWYRQSLWLFRQNRVNINSLNKGRPHRNPWGPGQTGVHQMGRPQGFYQNQYTQYPSGGYYDSPPLQYDPQSRNNFVGRVMAYVFVMLVITAAYIAFVLISPDLKLFFRRGGLFLLLPAMVGMMITNYAMFCSACARRPPCCFFVLALTVASLGTVAAVVSTWYRTVIVLYAAMATAAIVLVCLALACTSFDFTSYMLYIIVISVGFSFLALMIMIGMFVLGVYIKPVHIVLLIVSVLIQSVVLILELQMLLGGRSVELNEEDYALGAYMLYTSIVNIFIKMVQILGLLDS